MQETCQSPESSLLKALRRFAAAVTHLLSNFPTTNPDSHGFVVEPASVYTVPAGSKGKPMSDTLPVACKALLLMVAAA